MERRDRSSGVGCLDVLGVFRFLVVVVGAVLGVLGVVLGPLPPAAMADSATITLI